MDRAEVAEVLGLASVLVLRGWTRGTLGTMAFAENSREFLGRSSAFDLRVGEHAGCFCALGAIREAVRVLHHDGPSYRPYVQAAEIALDAAAHLGGGGIADWNDKLPLSAESRRHVARALRRAQLHVLRPNPVETAVNGTVAA